MFHNLERSHTPFRPNIASKIAKAIVNDVAKKVNDSQHLASKTRSDRNGHDVAEFDRKELKFGRLLGSGSFCEVHELRGISVRKKFDDGSHDNYFKPNREKMAAIEKKCKKIHPWVVKHLRPSLLKDQRDFIEAASELVLEAKYLSTLKHPNIIGIHAVATKDAESYARGQHDAFFVVIDRLESTLFDQIIKWKVAGDKLKVSVCRRLMMVHDLAAALEHLHDRNLVYRDLKPGNVGFDMNGDVKLFDFGLLAEIPKEGYLKQRSGTLRYMAPDCYMGKYNCKADVYSITVILWEVLAVRHYFDGASNLVHVQKIMQGNRETLDKNWPSGVNALMSQGWIGNLKERLSMHDFRIGLQAEVKQLRKQGKLDSTVVRKASKTKKNPTRFKASDFAPDPSILCGVNELFAA